MAEHALAMMGWKLGGLLVATVIIALSIVPIRTHAVGYDPSRDSPPPRPSIRRHLANMYLTPRTITTILAVAALAGFIAFKIVRGDW